MKNVDILEYMPTGKKNAISRWKLRELTHLSDRKVREEIHKARRKIPIINLSDGDGYYIPDMNLEEDVQALKRFVKQEENRLKSIGWALKAARKTLRNCGRLEK